ncbi:MAG: SUMF1/EgtB/PvdO family nonheme iron enzyme [Bacteroidota bacterium]
MKITTCLNYCAFRVSVCFILCLSFSQSKSQIPATTIATIRNLVDERQLILDKFDKSMILVDGGTFQMGATSNQGIDYSKDELPIHSVQISDFYLLKTEVTQELWIAIMESNPSLNQRSNQFPIENVTNAEVDAFIKRLNFLSCKNYRLPTEAEWEYAARGGKKSRNFMYAGSSDANLVSWNNYNANGKSHIVGTKLANELGIYDLSGNVWEYCSDWYGPYSAELLLNPKGPINGTEYIVRGGSWAGSSWLCRNSLRFHFSTDFKSPYVGFRLVEVRGK